MRGNFRNNINLILLIGGWVLAIVLGFWGFHLYFQSVGENRSAFVIAYLTIQLFVMESGAVDGTIPWQLEVARFLAPLMTASALVGATYNLFAQRLKLFGLELRGGHVILCGLGKKGAHLVHELIKKGKRVLVIEADILNPNIAECRNLGAVVIEAEANNNTVLKRVRIDKASRLIAVTGDDNVNIDTAILARELILTKGRKPRYGHLRCVSHVTDPAFRQRLKSRELYQDSNDPFDLELVSVYETGARIMIDKSGLFHYKNIGKGGKMNMNVLVIGFGHLGRTLLLRIVKEWRLESKNNEAVKLSFTVIDLKAGEKKDWFCECYQEFLEGIQLDFIERDVRNAKPGRLAGCCLSGDFIPDENSNETPVTESASPDQAIQSAAFVCFDNDVTAADAALNLDESLPDETPIVVRYSEVIGYASLLDKESKKKGGRKSRLHSIGFLEITCSDDQFLGGDLEILARAFHEKYLREVARKGELEPSQNPAHLPWYELDKAYKKINLALAGDLDGKLKKIGRKKVAVTDRPIDPTPLLEKDIYKLARDEHKRWCKDLLADGWKLGPDKIPEKKEHDLLKDWDELSPGEQEFNRNLMIPLPTILAAADFAIEEVD